MRPIRLLLAVLLSLSLPACVHTRLCGTAAPGKPVHVEVTYAADGTPQVNPETCHVRQGVVVTWRGPALDDTPFTLAFKGDPGTVTKGTSPSSEAMMVSLPSPPLVVEAAEGFPSREAAIKAENPGPYKYDVNANGRSLDPHIIIDR